MKVLIIEDNKDHQLLYVNRLLSFIPESNITAVASALEGLKKISSSISGYDLILLDYMLPDMDGIAFLQHLNDTGRNFDPVIMITGHGDQETAVSALKAGAIDYLVKPNLDRLQEIITSLKTPKAIFSAENIHLSFLGMDDRHGPQVIATEMLPFSTKNLILKYSPFYMAAIGQGEQKNEGLYGPLPSHSEYLALVYGRKMFDKSKVDTRSKGRIFTLSVIFFHRQFIHYFQHFRQIEQTISKTLDRINDINEIGEDFLLDFKQKIYSALSIRDLTVSLGSRNEALEKEYREANLLSTLLLEMIPIYMNDHRVTIPEIVKKELMNKMASVPAEIKDQMAVIEILHALKTSEESFEKIKLVEFLQDSSKEYDEEDLTFNISTDDEKAMKAVSFCQKENLRKSFSFLNIIQRNSTDYSYLKPEIKVELSGDFLKFTTIFQLKKGAEEVISFIESLKWHPELPRDAQLGLLIFLGMKSFLRKHKGHVHLNYSKTVRKLEVIMNLPIISIVN
ncbi:MAG: response regulator [Candidatus Hodarchaeales archaeon]|jgi:CheY-like chemotaxis protein